MHTRQETFDTSCLALIAQGRPGWDHEDAGCSYSQGCAAAHLFPPGTDCKVLDQTMCMANAGPVAEALKCAGHSPEFVRELQRVHDRASRWAYGPNVKRAGDASVEEIAAFVTAWRCVWLPGIVNLAEARGLSPDRVLQAARLAGWDLACIAQ